MSHVIDIEYCVWMSVYWVTEVVRLEETHLDSRSSAAGGAPLLEKSLSHKSERVKWDKITKGRKKTLPKEQTIEAGATFRVRKLTHIRRLT